MSARVFVGGINANIGVKQGCFGTCNFNRLLVSLILLSLLFHNDISESDGIPLSYQLGGNLFNHTSQ